MGLDPALCPVEPSYMLAAVCRGTVAFCRNRSIPNIESGLWLRSPKLPRLILLASGDFYLISKSPLSHAAS